MRILQIDKFLDTALPSSGGVGSVVRRWSDLLRGRGHEVLFFGCDVSGRNEAMPRYRDFAASRNPLNLARMIHNGEAARKLERFLESRGPVDVAHVHNIYHHLTPSILPVLARHGAVIVLTPHDYRLSCPTKHFLRPDGVCTRCLGNHFYHAASPRCAGWSGAALAIETYIQRYFRRYLRYVRLFLCPSDFMRQVMVRYGAAADQARVLRNPVEPLMGAFSSLRRELLFAGRLSWEKNPQMMLDVAQRLPDVTMVLAGDGPLMGELTRQVSSRNLANVRLLGQVRHDQLGGHLSAAMAVVITSRCFENSPQTMLEAMQAGKGVIGPDFPTLREWIEPEKTGLLYEPNNVDQLAARARRMVEDESLRRCLGAAAADYVSRVHEVNSLTDQLLGHYEEARRRCALP